jgi:hypothetical protein
LPAMCLAKKTVRYSPSSLIWCDNAASAHALSGAACPLAPFPLACSSQITLHPFDYS